MPPRGEDVFLPAAFDPVAIPKGFEDTPESRLRDAGLVVKFAARNGTVGEDFEHSDTVGRPGEKRDIVQRGRTQHGGSIFGYYASVVLIDGPQRTRTSLETG
ncbi:hypothetical protein ACFQH8_19700 [Halomicroarcula sp. GCM10025710]